MDAAKRA